MTKTLQKIKDEVARELSYEDLQHLQYDFSLSGLRMEIFMGEVAVRYAQEQNKELMEMLEIVIKDYENIIPQSPARDNRMQQIKELIKQATEG